MVQVQDWQNWRNQESSILAGSIEFAGVVFNTTDVGIEGSRHYGTGLLAQSIECARAIRHCIHQGTASPAFALARAQYEGAMRGHIIIREIGLEGLDVFLRRIGSWVEDKQTVKGLPKIEVRKTKWRIVGLDPKPVWHPLQHETAKLFAGSVGGSDMVLLHDLAHSGMTHALQMRREDGIIGPRYSDKDQTLLLYFADRAVMFSIMIWPGAEQMYCREIERRMEKTSRQRSPWADIIHA